MILKNILRGIGTFLIVVLLFFSLMLAVFLGPDIVGEPSLVDGQTFLGWTIWMAILLISYLLLTRSFILNLLMIPLLHLWTFYLFGVFNSSVPILDKLMALEGFIVVIICLISGIVKSDLMKKIHERGKMNA